MRRPANESAATDEPLIPLPHFIAFFVLWALLQLTTVIAVFPEALQGAQIDPDGYMRLVRVNVLLDHGNWFDHSIPRSNWPFGETLHWTRPLDVLIIALSLPFRIFFSSATAIAV